MGEKAKSFRATKRWQLLFTGRLLGKCCAFEVLVKKLPKLCCGCLCHLRVVFQDVPENMNRSRRRNVKGVGCSSIHFERHGHSLSASPLPVQYKVLLAPCHLCCRLR